MLWKYVNRFFEYIQSEYVKLSNISLDEIIRAKIGYTYLVVFEIGVYNWTLCKTSRMHIMTIGSTWSLKTLKVFTGISKVSPVDARTFTPLSKSNFELKQQISKILFNPDTYQDTIANDVMAYLICDGNAIRSMTFNTYITMLGKLEDLYFFTFRPTRSSSRVQDDEQNIQLIVCNV